LLPDVNLIPTPATLRFGVRTSGARISYVLPGSNADAAGLRAGDLVIEVNDQAIGPGNDFDEALARCCRAGGSVTLQVVRNGVPRDLNGRYELTDSFGATVPLFPRRHPSGRVDLVKTANTVRATTAGVAEYTLLLSPDAFDFAKPVRVISNGRVVFDGRVETSVRTLLKWAAIDNDRTMLFGAELHVTLA
jgi:hypothetical protein